MAKIEELQVGVRYVKCSECERNFGETATWKYHEEEDVYTCSNCGFAALNDYRGASTDSPYCPTCGARMTNSKSPILN